MSRGQNKVKTKTEILHFVKVFHNYKHVGNGYFIYNEESQHMKSILTDFNGIELPEGKFYNLEVTENRLAVVSTTRQ